MYRKKILFSIQSGNDVHQIFPEISNRKLSDRPYARRELIEVGTFLRVSIETRVLQAYTVLRYHRQRGSLNEKRYLR